MRIAPVPAVPNVRRIADLPVFPGDRFVHATELRPRRSKSPMNDQAATLRLAVVPRSGFLVDALLVLGGAAFVGLCAQISYQPSFTPVPYTLQTFSVLLVGAAYGAMLGAASLSLYLILGLVGVPLFAEHKHGWDVF